MKKLLAIVSCLFFIPAAVAAPATTAPQNNHFSWTYADAGLSSHDYDNSDSNVTALDGDLSYAIDNHLYALAGLSYGWVHSLNLWDLHGGLGFHTPLVNNLDVFGEGEINLDRTEFHGHSQSDNGFTLRAGVRARPVNNDAFDLKGGIYHVDVDGSDTGVFGSALYSLDKSKAVGLRLTLGDKQKAVGLFVRFNL